MDLRSRITHISINDHTVTGVTTISDDAADLAAAKKNRHLYPLTD